MTTHKHDGSTTDSMWHAADLQQQPHAIPCRTPGTYMTQNTSFKHNAYMHHILLDSEEQLKNYMIASKWVSNGLVWAPSR